MQNMPMYTVQSRFNRFFAEVKDKAKITYGGIIDLLFSVLFDNTSDCFD